MNKEEQLQSQIIQLYTFYMKEVLLIRDFDLKVEDLDRKNFKLLNNFILKIKNKGYLHSIGVEWLIDYFDRQFQYWLYMQKNNRLKYGLSSIQLSWVIGGKAYERYDNDLKEFYGTTLKVEFRKKIKASIFKLLVPSPLINLIEISVTEEKEKLRYYNTEATMLWCIQETTLFNPLSELCKKCAFKRPCVKTLKINYPKLYTKRLKK